MSNIREYKDLYAFHPGSYIEEIIDDLNITQKEYAEKLGITEKTLSKLVNGEIKLSKEVASKISKATGMSVQTWLNLQNKFDEEVLKIEEVKQFERDKEIMQAIDYSYFKKMGLVENKRASIEEKIKNLWKLFSISNLEYLTILPDGISYRNKKEIFDNKTIINSNIMLQLGLNIANKKDTPKYDKKKLEEFLDKIKRYTINPPEASELIKELSECGIVLVLLPHLKNAGINGAVKKLKSGSIMLLINDKGKTSDIFWFTLLHELSHIVNNEYEINLLGSESESDNEKRADKFARDLLIDEESYKEFVNKGEFSEYSVVSFANSIKIHPGIVVGRLQNDKYINYYELSDLKQKMEIIINN